MQYHRTNPYLSTSQGSLVRTINRGMTLGGVSSSTLDAVRAAKTTLRSGSKGDAVRTLQHMLNKIGAASPPLAEDGIFGAKTKQAVVNLQRSAGITVDGIVGRQTMRVIDRKLGGEPFPSASSPSMSPRGGPPPGQTEAGEKKKGKGLLLLLGLGALGWYIYKKRK